MKAFTGWAITAGLVFAATAANAQGAPQQAGPARYQATSDIARPYADAPPPSAPAYEPPPPPRVVYGSPAYEGGYGYGGYGPAVLPPHEVYAVLRENGFSPLGAPRLRGLFYSIAAIDHRGDDGRLVIDARDGRIVRFVPADHFGRYGGYGGYGDSYYGAPPPRPAYGPLEPMTRLDSAPPPAAPRMASRTPSPVPMPKAAPARPAGDQPAAAKPTSAPTQQSAAMQVKPADAPAAAAPVEAKPAAPVIQPTQPMPKVQDLE